MDNYNQSSTGINLELIQGYDPDLASMYYEESFEVVARDNRGDTATILYTNGGDVGLEDLVPQVKHNASNYKKARAWLFDNSNDWDKSWGYADTWSELDWYLEDAGDWYDEEGGYWDIIKEAGLELKPIKYEIVASRGYSQGDYVEVIVPDSVTTGLKKDIDHLIWDAPYWGRLTIDEDEYCLEEYMVDAYEVGEDEVLEAIKKVAETLPKKTTKVLMQWVGTINLLPTYN